MEFDRTQIDERFESLKREFQPWIPALKELRQFLLPTHGRFPGEMPNQGKKIDHTEILDGSPARAIQKTAAGFAAHLTSPSAPWLALTLRDKDLARLPRVRDFLGICADRILSVFAESNTYPYLGFLYEEFIAFGLCVGYTEEHLHNVINNRSFTVGEYMLGAGEDGAINTFAREYDITVAQLVERFGLDHVSLDTQKLFKDNKPDTWRKCRHLVVPNTNRSTGRLDNANMPLLSVYWEPGAKKNEVLSRSGYLEFPFQAGRWKVVSSDTYSKGPGWDALGDCKELQKVNREYLIALEKVNDPPTQGPAESEVETVPGGFTPTSDQSPEGGVRATYQINPNLEAMLEKIKSKRADIRETFFADRFLALETIERGMTAREVFERTMENLRAVGPVVVKLQTEILDPLVRRTFNIMNRAGLLPQIPEELDGESINIEYVSAMAQAQRAGKTQALQEHLLFVAEAAKSDGTVIDVIDYDQAARWHGENLGIPSGIDRSAEDVARIREGRAQQQSEAAAAELIERGAGAARELSGAKLGDDNALSRLLGKGEETEA